MSGEQTVTATCAWCAWTTRLTTDAGATVVEVATAVRRLVVEHAEHEHPEQFRLRTHYSRWDEPGGRFVRALCGVLIQRRAHHNVPTCPDCTALVAAQEQAVGP